MSTLVLRDVLGRITFNFDPDQARDESGKWTAGGGGGAAPVTPPPAAPGGKAEGHKGHGPHEGEAAEAVHLKEEFGHVKAALRGDIGAVGGLLGGVVGEKLDKALGGESLKERWLARLHQDFGHFAPYALAAAAGVGLAAKSFLGHHLLGHLATSIVGGAAEGVLGEMAKSELGEKMVDKASEVLGEALPHALPYVAAAGVMATYGVCKLLQVDHVRQTAAGQKLGMAHEAVIHTKAAEIARQNVHRAAAAKDFLFSLPRKGAALGTRGAIGAAKIAGRGLAKAATVGVKDYGEGAAFAHNVLYLATGPLLVGNAPAGDMEQMHAAGMQAYLDLYGQMLQSLKASPDFQKMLADPEQRQHAVSIVAAFAHGQGEPDDPPTE